MNLGFIHLRDHVPHSTTSKKLSKVETLREAARYIKYLEAVLHGTCDKPFEPIHSTAEPPIVEQCSTQENCYIPTPMNNCAFQLPNQDNYLPQQYFQNYGSTNHFRSDNFYPLKPHIDSTNSIYLSPESADGNISFEHKRFEL